ncbi:MAG: MCE family protein [Verrucomicrobiae bacterium]|nr:MCE family protein [Verrucomicrobiae bacterium]
MQKKGVELWVGLFVIIGLATVCGMILHFGQFRENLRDMYHIEVRFTNAGQINRGAPVIMAGVNIGKVESIMLEREGGVKLSIGVWNNIKVRKDSKFTVKQAGLLGDLQVVVVPGSPNSPNLGEGDVIDGINPTDIQDTLEQAAQIVIKMKSAADNIESATLKLDREVMNPETLANLRAAISNINVASAHADQLIEDARGLVGKTKDGIDTTMANLNQFSTNLSAASAKTLDIVKNNEDDIRTAVQNIKTSSERLNTVLAKVEEGKGNIGWLLKDEAFHDDLKRLMSNLRRFGILKYKDAPLPPEEKKPEPGSSVGSSTSPVRSKP